MSSSSVSLLRFERIALRVAPEKPEFQHAKQVTALSRGKKQAKTQLHVEKRRLPTLAHVKRAVSIVPAALHL